MPVLRFPTSRTCRIARTIVASAFAAGVALIVANSPSFVSSEHVTAGPAPVAPGIGAPEGFVLPPALVESRELAYSPPTF